MYDSSQFPARADGCWIINKVIRTTIFKKTVQCVNSGEIPFIKIKNTEWKKNQIPWAVTDNKVYFKLLAVMILWYLKLFHDE